ncbi:hypothetical protein MCOR28_006475 [Pyricularia oryzae]|nr:hypothetical protein MCOR26_010801 [Pyricularia oryzae]KAI6340584.1 hypothetical protein MCOR28_006475 [Pyricularia oryzae]
MLWASWTTAGPFLLLVCAIIAWWLTEPKTHQLNAIVFVGCIFFCWAVNPSLARDSFYRFVQISSSTVVLLNSDTYIGTNATMIFTGAAVLWLLRRAAQTLWKPVPELIGVLGLEVPDSPDVSLTGIAADKATLTWTRAQPSRPVQKFLIQVNGVNVGEIASNQDNFIIVSGLKPDHFYNVRVIAVGISNFQAGSRVIRLRTFSRDGRPQLGNSRLPSNFTSDEQGLSSQVETVDENGAPRSPVPTVETAVISESIPPIVPRDANAPTATVLRRNTIGRRHSPSTTSLDQPTIPPQRSDPTEPTDAQMDSLGEKYKTLLRETEELADLIAKEEEDHKRMMNELEAEKQEKKKEQKEKEGQTEKLRREQGTAERQMRNALARKSQKEKVLKEKQTELAKMVDRTTGYEKGIEEMSRDQQGFAQEKQQLEEQKKTNEEGYKAEINTLSTECGNLEAELRERRTQVKELEDARKRFVGGEDDLEWQEKDAEARREWHRRERELHNALEHENKQMRVLDQQVVVLSEHLVAYQSRELYTQANSSGVEFADTLHNSLKRRSRNGNSMNTGIPSPSLAPAYTVSDAAPHPPPGSQSSRLQGPAGFAPGPFMALPADDALDASESHEEAIRALTGDAPLSPTAKALLPSHIFLDMDDEDQESPFIPPPRVGSPANDPQSPHSSNQSMSILSSPHGSSNNLPFPAFDAGDRGSINSPRDISRPMPSPPQHQSHSGGKSSLVNLLRFQRSRGNKVGDEEGPALGSLKLGQSQSFPRQTDEPEGLAGRRKLSLSSWNVFHRNSAGPELLEGMAPQTSDHKFSARTLLPFGGHRAASGVFGEGSQTSPRPMSIASAEMPRPSADGNAIWGPPGEGNTIGKPWQPWTSHDNAWSRNPSRRPSVHGSPSALKTTLASADDEILDDEALMKHSMSQVGVIGSRPATSKKAMMALNPAAPTFMTGLFKSSKDKKDKTKGKEGQSSAETPVGLAGDISPSDSRVSRDAPSIRTQPSVTESRESLALDISTSHTLSDATSPILLSASSAKDPAGDNVVKKLFRKGSSSKFSFSSRLGKSKGPGSTTASSDKNGPVSSDQRSSIGDLDDAGEELILGRSYDSVTSSPSLGPSKRPESRMSSTRWFSSMKKKGKEKESLELDRGHESVDEGDEKKTLTEG